MSQPKRKHFEKVKISVGYGKNKTEKLIYPAEQLDLNTKQFLVLNKVLEGHNIAIMGSAGSGKSYVLKRICHEMQTRGYTVEVTASTGIAASNLGIPNSKTLHAFSGAGLCTESLSYILESIQNKVKARWRDTEVLIIDEISMITPYFFHVVDQIAKTIRRNSAPFGGIQVIVCGDWAQLNPVTRDTYPEPFDKMEYCFQTETWEKLFKDENIIVLDSIFRQGSDPNFIKILEGIREGRINKKYYDMLKSRVGAILDLPQGVRPTKIYPRNDQVDEENMKELEQLEGVTMEYNWVETCINIAKNDGKFALESLAKRMPVERNIYLKKGALIVLTYNISHELGYVNGLQGVVTDFDPDTNLPIVDFVNGKTDTIRPREWSQSMGGDKYAKNKRRKGSDEFCGVRIKQLPLRLAFAITCHRSQGMTLRYVQCDLGKNNFAPGQAYTAISRCTELAGLTLSKFSKKSIICNPLVKEFYTKYTAMKLDNIKPTFLLKNVQESTEDESTTVETTEESQTPLITSTNQIDIVDEPQALEKDVVRVTQLDL